MKSFGGYRKAMLRVSKSEQKASILSIKGQKKI